ncbi:MAG: tetratricopeptide repeat protein [Trueperaceae bacterium]
MPRAWLALLLLGVAGMAWSQPDAQALLTRARAAAAEARTSYEIHTPDQRLWDEALDLAREARRIAPDDLGAARFLAQTYSEVHWYVRALEAWLEYLEAGGDLQARADEPGPDPAAALAEAGNQLGFARYEAGNLAAALGYYQTVLRHVPDDPETLYWLGRINLELDEEEAARGYFERLVAVDPDHETASYYLTLVDERVRVGETASRAYRRGLSAYEEENLPAAHDAFVRALSANSGFIDAAVWAGRTALELERPADAVRYWELVAARRPDDRAAEYFLEVSRTQSEWGVAAGRAFFQGQAAYEAGDVEGAADAFERALEANPEMVEAWVWAARSNQESGDPEAAVGYWQGVLERRPEDERARYFLRIARQQIEFGEEAGLAFVEAVRHYQLAELDQAEEGFLEAVAENPDFASAWAWLGRLYFARGDYREAADAYSRAYDLEPSNGDYAFFAEEAERLADGSLGEPSENVTGDDG